MNLFDTEANLQISRITEKDILLKTDLLKVFNASILKHELMYPKIATWLKNKVLPGILNGTRVAYLGFLNDEPVATAVAKLGKSTKFCHLHLNKDIQNRNLGELFFSLMVVDVRHIANGIHFTLPESLWENEKNFFRSFGFEKASTAPTQYRKFEEELICKSTFDKVWQLTLEKLPKLIDTHSIHNNHISNGLLMSIRPEFAKKIFDGDKIFELRKKFNHKWSNRRVTLYSSHPTKSIMGYATIQHIKSGPPARIWSLYGSELGCTKLEFENYTKGQLKIYAIQLSGITQYKSPMPLSQLAWFLDKNLVPPQSYTSLKQNKNWLNAISVADILQGRFSTFIQAI